jgi:hypothetical protein
MNKRSTTEVFQGDPTRINFANVHGFLCELYGYQSTVAEDGDGLMRPLTRPQAVDVIDQLQSLMPEVSGAQPKIVYEKDEWDDSIYRRWLTNYGEDISATTMKAAGAVVEFAGPTDWQRDNGLGGSLMPIGVEPDLVSNLNRDYLEDDEEVDYFDDVCNTLHPNESIGTFAISCLDGAQRFSDDEDFGLRDGAIAEAGRIVRPGGYLVWQGGVPQDAEKAIEVGFDLATVKFKTGIEELNGGYFIYPSIDVDFIARKRA